MSASWGSMKEGSMTDRNAKWMIRVWFLLACAGLLFIRFGGRV
jgi:hypothetical protein